MNEKSIAILPFLNLSSDPENEYFSDGITEEIINSITRVQGLKVTARTSSFAFKGKHMDVRHIGNQLGVASVLEGSIRKVSNKVRITANLVRTSDGFQMWSGKYNRELDDIFALQDEISHDIVENVRENFGHLEIQDQLVDVPTKSFEAYNLYLKARFNHLKWDGPGIRMSIELYKQCIDLDPSFSWPYFGLGYSFSMSGSWNNQPDFVDLAEDYIMKGFEIQQDSDLGYFALGTMYFWGRWDIKKGVENYKKALELNPSNTEAEEGLAELYTATGEFDKALKCINQMLIIDPLSPNHYFTKANAEYFQSDFQQSLETITKGLEINPTFAHLIERIQFCYIYLGDWDGLNHFLETNELAENPSGARFLYKLINKESYSEEERDLVNFDINSDEVLLMPWTPILYAQVGEKERAISYLSEMVERKQGQFVNFKNMPSLKPLSGTDEFEQLKASVLSQTDQMERSDVVNLEQASKALMMNSELAKFKRKVEELMLQEKAFIDPQLSLRKLAEMAGLHPNKLSWMLNEEFEMNFNDYVNSYRLKEFQEKATLSESKNFTLLGLAFESGFNSKTTFNYYFKKKTGVTPKKWLKAQAN